MRWIKKNAATHFIALLSAFTMLMAFSLLGAESLSTGISFPKGEDGLSEIVHHFPDQAVEPIILTGTDDSGFSAFRFASQRFCNFFGPVAPESASGFSPLHSRSTERPLDGKSAILLKLRI